MPSYNFVVRTGTTDFPDDVPVHCPDDHAARRYAEDVARDLMQGREVKTRHWQVSVRDAAQQELFHVGFVSADRSLDHLEPGFRFQIETLCQRLFALAETIRDSRHIARSARATVAFARGKPYLATHDGQSTAAV
jgi:hypothetical protein